MQLTAECTCERNVSQCSVRTKELLNPFILSVCVTNVHRMFNGTMLMVSILYHIAFVRYGKFGD